MRRFGERIKRTQIYSTRVSVYGIIIVGEYILLTEQDEDEIQLPGGGVEPQEYKTQALIRECYEETGWKIAPARKLGVYQRFVFMPEYDLWAHKICHMYLCQGIYPLSKPTEKGHIALFSTPEQAKKLLGKNVGDISFVKQVFGI